ncbi:DUF624 domain-containing protein [Alteribacter keqinensis]|nr:DUF624 domain-containing protein [Alteribacter keqinensis]
MKQAMTVFYRSIFDTYQHLWTLVWATMLWWICILPVVTSGPATAGLFYVVKKIRNGEPAVPGDFFKGAHKYKGIGLKISCCSIFITVPGGIYFFILLGTGSFIAYFTAMIILYMVLMWFLLLLYVMPLMVEQDIHSLSLLLKRSFRLLSENYLFTINMALYLLLLTFFSTVITIIMAVWAGWIAKNAYNALIFLLHKHEVADYEFSGDVSWKGAWRTWK